MVAGEAVCDAAAACDDGAVSGPAAAFGGEAVSDAVDEAAFLVRGRFGVTSPVWICADGKPRSSATHSRLGAMLIRCWSKPQ